MINKASNDKKGFTIIEVVLVLAVAALIFLIVFLAVPSLQRSRRDTARKNDLGRLMSQLESYASNNNGDYPTTGNFNNFVTQYMGNDFKDPSKGTAYKWVGTDPALGQVQYGTNKKCSADNKLITGSGGIREIAVRIRIEQGGASATYFCQDNQ
jgi:prepilin-type N-terminal cleavage/methylation domain-containing protein